MKQSTLFSAAVVISSASAQNYNDWQAPKADDVRGPCPMLNTLANHGFLPHSGKNIDYNRTAYALSTAINVGADLATDLFAAAIETNPAGPNVTTFDLNHLTRHNILEHDASLSRVDAHFGDAGPFNQTIFDQTRQFWTGETVTVQMAANARAARELVSMVENPEYSLSGRAAAFSSGEGGGYLMIMGRGVSGEAPKAWVESFFVNERLPLDLGWTRPDYTFGAADLKYFQNAIVNATLVPAEPAEDEEEKETGAKKRLRLH
ncbi:Cloroperoxidase [Xylariomycetidae sp. FL2044]|nr:Cloroperoxidase [Xylariomycetidae sp. FL2044]